MALLYYTDNGNVSPTSGDEVSRYSWLRKTFHIHEEWHRGGTLSVFLREYPDNREPLEVIVNGKSWSIYPGRARHQFRWITISVGSDALRQGTNHVVLKAGNHAYNSWIVGLDGSVPNQSSSRSVDEGKTWYNGPLGYDHSTQGEYAIRLLVRRQQQNPLPLPLIWEDLDHPRLKILRNMQIIKEIGAHTESTFERAISLRDTVHRQWKNHLHGEVYSPWDAFSMIEWNRKNRGHPTNRPIGFCVHYGICFIQFCQAMRIVARPVVFEKDEKSCPSGHFCAEVYCPEWERWILVDVWADAYFRHRGNPLSALDLHRLDQEERINEVEIVKGPFFETGPGAESDWLERFLKHHGARRWGIWPRTDFFSSPWESPSAHGRLMYTEPGFLWWRSEEVPRRPYFPFVSDTPDHFYPPKEEMVGPI